MFLKRLWDTENKKTVRATGPSGKKCQVWTNDDGSKLYIYDASQWLVCNTQPTGYEYGPTDRKELDDQTVWFYDTNKPTELFSWDEGDEVSYVFKDWDGTVLKSWKIAEGQTPTAPADPTREATAQYTYTFAGWNPTVWPISKRTTFTATYTATVNKYDILFVDEDGTTELDSQELDYWATPVYAGETPTKEATAQYTYTFSGWTPDIATVTGDATYTATYTATENKYTVTIEVNSSDYGYTEPWEITNVPYGTTVTENADHSLSIGTVTVTPHANTWYYFSSWEEIPETIEDDTTLTAQFNIEDYTISIASEDVTKGTVDVASETADYWTTISAVDNVLTIGYTNITATPETGYVFSAWTDENGDPLPETVTWALSVVAKFTSAE